ncbi:ribosomal protein S18 acetylase RimI-like enzyme [Chitinivorax tropicus]|uniref:Ribosomal protein S18 acetylase RimI-like enzyme n=1 Tax=Chitinivorax tropicus TaxID=714531 RepID=A0A840MRL3_9PROT|nr:GNAT family N-acetyltransferase [Chitinivorax tropicus]MBB5019747.1 ribosomal protein S18 acetylase RimI-like enzyme [Chitinivorax tropicus]
MPQPTLTTYDSWPTEALIIDQGLEDSNASAAPLHEVKQLACLARSESGQVIGGVLGRWWGKSCELQELWVLPERRGAGLGSSLVCAFEQLASQQGCSNVYLETFSFQAPRLYLSLGYEIQYQRSGFPHGIIKYHMEKALASSSTQASTQR